ncbi:MAG: GEVED domain-containing protein [Cyanobacteria bacterium J06643_4]
MPQARAEGSRDMFASGEPGNRGHIVWRNSFRSGFRKRTLLRVFANQDDYILLGSSAVGVGQGDIELYDPGTVTGAVANEVLPANAAFSCQGEQPGRGFIANRAQELAGPISIDGSGNTAGYQPCYYQAPTTGVYYVAMYGPSGSNSNQSPNAGVEHSTNAINTGTTQRTGISAWDVTVRDSLGSVSDLTGRLHTYHLALNMGQNFVNLHADIYPITTDGYRYRIETNGLDPFGFSMFGNQLGNLDSDGMNPLYHDVLGSNGDIDNPAAGVESASPQYPFFFNEIDGAAVPFLSQYDPLTGFPVGLGFPAMPILPEVTTPTFAGNLAGSTSTVGAGGTFLFSSNLPSGTYEIVVSQDGIDFDPGNPDNKVINGYMATSGPHIASWDGYANNRQPFPVGAFPYAITIRGGEYHFPMSDVENNPMGGPRYYLLNATNPRGNTVGFYDHRGYYTLNDDLVPDRNPGDGDPTDDALCGLLPPSMVAANLVTGSDSTAPSFNAFGFTSGGRANTNVQCTGAFGDTKTLDLWTYFPSDPPATDLIVVRPTDFGDAPDPTALTGSGDYTTLAEHGGAAHAIAAVPILLGSGITTDANGFADGVDSQGNATDDSDDALAALAAPPVSGQYVLNNIPLRNETGNAATLHGWIDFNRNGVFEVSEYASAALGPNDTAADLVWTVPSAVSPGTSYARFRLTSDTLSDDVATSSLDERSVGPAIDGEVEDYQIMLLASDVAPQVLLVKRITAVAGGQVLNPNDGTPLDQFVDVTTGPQANDDNHTNWPANYLLGAPEGGIVRPVSEQLADSLEYTIYFLSAGGSAANGVLLCDRIPPNTDYLSDAYRSAAPNSPPPSPLSDPFGARGIALNVAGSDYSLTGKSDGDAGYYFPPGVEPSTVFPTINCNGPNDNGAIVVNLGNLPPATGAGTPAAAYGALRFQVRLR